MLVYTTINDYLVLSAAHILSIFKILICWSQYSTTRPLPPKNISINNTRTIISCATLYSKYYTVYKVYFWGVLTIYSLLILVKHPAIVYTSAQTINTEYYWLYLQVIYVVILTTWLVYSTRANLGLISSDAMISMLIIISCIQLYYLIANIWSLTLLLECQGMGLILLLATDNNFVKSTLKNTHMTLKQLSNFKITQAIVLQFWVGFLGAALLLFIGVVYTARTGATHWQDFTHLILMEKYLKANTTWLLIVSAIMLLSLLLKTGAFPMHFWKPELYNNLRLINVFIYAIPYSVAVTFIAILLFTLLMLTSPQLTKWLLIAILIISTYVIIPLLLIVTEIKAFLAYTSGLHVLYIYAAVTVDRFIATAAILYNITYCLAALTVFTALLNFRHNSIKYLTDLQIYTHLPTKIAWLSIGIATMAGVPPLLGFWAKFNVLYSLWANAEMIVTIHLLSVSMIYMYFYIAIYRFMGATNFRCNPMRVIMLNTAAIATIGLITTSIHITGVWNATDVSNWSTLFAQQLYDYA